MSLIIEDDASTEMNAEETDETISPTATVPELTLRVIRDIYKNGKPAPNQNQIVNRVTEIKNLGASYPYAPKSQQPAVSRALKNLVAKNAVIKTKANRYLPYNLETGRAILKPEIIKNVKFGKKAIFQMSPTTWLLDIERSSMATAKTLFTQYLGPNCYDIIEFNGYLMLLFAGRIKEHEDLRREIMNIRKEAIKKNNTNPSEE